MCGEDGLVVEDLQAPDDLVIGFYQVRDGCGGGWFGSKYTSTQK